MSTYAIKECIRDRFRDRLNCKLNETAVEKAYNIVARYTFFGGSISAFWDGSTLGAGIWGIVGIGIVGQHYYDAYLECHQKKYYEQYE